jgi:RNA polymerase sigma-70 factor (ECF subfamily)
VLDDFDGVLGRARAGSGEAFTLIYEELAGPVAGYLRARGVAEVEDLTSEVFLAVFTGLGSFSGSQGQFRSWVFTIAHHRAADHWRRAGRTVPQTPYEPQDDPRTVASAEHEALDRIGTEQVTRLLGLLTDEQREVLTLRVVGDLTVDQVAEVVGRSPGAVKALQRRALATLRRTIEQEAVPL